MISEVDLSFIGKLLHITTIDAEGKRKLPCILEEKTDEH
jgi:hypothetical protein